MIHTCSYTVAVNIYIYTHTYIHIKKSFLKASQLWHLIYCSGIASEICSSRPLSGSTVFTTFEKVKKLPQPITQKDEEPEIMRQVWKFQHSIEKELQKEQREWRKGNISKK